MQTKKGPRIEKTNMNGNLIKSKKNNCQNGHKIASIASDNNNDYGIDNEVDDIVTINVGGTRHETKLSTLQKWPNTRLHSVAETARTTGKRDFYFDRNPHLFVNILNYYRIGQLHMPGDICGPVAKAEIDYWELDEKEIQQCCWVKYISYEETEEMLKPFERDEEEIHKDVDTDDRVSFWAQTRPKLWKAIQDPYSSKKALIFAIVSLMVVLLSITVFVVETLPTFDDITAHAPDSSKNITSKDLLHELEIFTDISPTDALLLIDNTCNLLLFIEFIVKMWASPNRVKFVRSPSALIDLLALIPYYIGLMIIKLHPDPITLLNVIQVLFATRILRIFRLFELMKHFLALKILMYTIAASTKELLLLLIVVLIGVIIFACIEYYMELFSGIETEIKHIPIACWWAIITMTTIGYGDIVPKSVPGYLVGACCAISGILVIALSVPVIVNNFTIYYLHAQARDKLRKRKKRSEQAQKWRRLNEGMKENLNKKSIFGIFLREKKSNSVEAFAPEKADSGRFNKNLFAVTKIEPLRTAQERDIDNDTSSGKREMESN
ncbi:hypothetical protein CHS0354_014560 [Potamilus streckersoni]|uniref:BTB domain-containing protein n=1 Tax=Potamilus streckersoni TaxID=2493646 RepID=A0AAE0RQQ5_9BIVA|nr:hypothetical protein CHS0354_014560 [Potamilus streckersoni]